jgi:hypothetical protein
VAEVTICSGIHWANDAVTLISVAGCVAYYRSKAAHRAVLGKPRTLLTFEAGTPVENTQDRRRQAAVQHWPTGKVSADSMTARARFIAALQRSLCSSSLQLR